MSRIIDTVTVGGIEDRRLVLGGAQAARTMSIGSTWNTLRLGMRFCVADSGAALAGTPRLYFGVMETPTAGLANGPLGDSGHFLGVRTQVTSWTRSTTTFVNYNTTQLIPCKRVGWTETLGTSVSQMIPATPSVGRFRTLMLEITKGSPNFTVYFIRPTSVVDSEFTLEEFKAAMNTGMFSDSNGVVSYLGSVTGSTTHTASTSAIAVDEGTDGSLNSVVVAWDKLNTPLYVSDVCYALIA